MEATQWVKERCHEGEQVWRILVGRGEERRPCVFKGIHGGDWVSDGGRARCALFAVQFGEDDYAWVVHRSLDTVTGPSERVFRVRGAELELDGKWEMLGYASGVARALTMEEALAM